ncbi:hypothetical protein OY671_009785, partial [Metschnikowia pulcherrima]
ARAGREQAGQHGGASGGEHRRADRHREDKSRAARAGAVLARAAHAASRLEMPGVTEIEQGIEAGHRLEHDIAALAAFTAIGAAIFDVLFSPEADRAGAAGARTDENLGSVEKMHGSWSPDKRSVKNTGGAEGDRTPDLVIANDALSQSSYGPVP